MSRPILAVFGGSFDPPHIGHVMLPTYLLARGLAQRVVIPVSFAHPFGKSMSPFGQRLAWTRAAMRQHGTAVHVSDIERELGRARPGPTYTIDVLEQLAARHTEYDVRLVVGSDLVQKDRAPDWHRWEDIERRFAPIVVPRRCDEEDPGVLPAISSTQIREWLAARPNPEAQAKLSRHLPAAVWRQVSLSTQPRELLIVGHGHAATRLADWAWSRGVVVTVIGAREVMAQPHRAHEQVGPNTIGVWLLAADPHLETLATALAGAGLATSLPVLIAAGARQSSATLAPLAASGHPVGTLHPICSLRREHEHNELENAGFGIEGDPEARALALELIGDAPWLDLQAHDAHARARYHAACSLAANHLAVLFADATTTLTSLGHDQAIAERCVASLMASALANLEALGVPAGVTGPAARGDRATLAVHAAALDEDVGRLYEVLSRRLLSLLEG